MRDSRFTKIDKNIYYFWLFVAVTAEEHYGAHDAMLDDCITQSDSLIRFVLEITICWRFISIFRDKKKQTSFFQNGMKAAIEREQKSMENRYVWKNCFLKLLFAPFKKKIVSHLWIEGVRLHFESMWEKRKKALQLLSVIFDRINGFFFLTEKKPNQTRIKVDWIRNYLNCSVFGI